MEPHNGTNKWGARLALGLGRLGGEDISDADAARVLGAALDLGVRVFDAAPSYGHAERRLGDFARSVGRERVIVSTKGGYGVPGVPDWTAECIEKGVDLALARMGLDFIDVLHLHSCPREVLEGAGVIDALRRAQQAGKVGSVGYSGENEALAFAAERCDVVQCSVSIADQHSLDEIIPRAAARGVAVFAKRPLASGAWREGRALDHAGSIYRDRLRVLGFDFGERWLEVAVRFSAFAPGVVCALVGTQDPGHLAACTAAIALGPLPQPELLALRDAFARHGAHWGGEI